MQREQHLTHKIQLLVNSSDATIKQQVTDTLYRWQALCFRSANMILAHQFVQDQVKQFFYFTEGLQQRLANINSNDSGMLNTSRLNTTYQVLSRAFKGRLPSDIFSNLNTALYKQYNNNREAIWRGELFIHPHKRNLPMPFKGRSIKELQKTDNGHDYSFTLFKQPLRTYLGKDRFFKKGLLDKIISGELKLCDSALQLHKRKIFLLLTTSHIIADRTAPDAAVVAEVRLGPETPLMVTIGSKIKATIGNKEEFLYRRLAIQQAVRRQQQSVPYNRSSNGKKRQRHFHSNLKEAEANYIQHKCHLYSRRLMDLCLKHHAGTLVLCNDKQDIDGQAEANKFLLRNWSAGNLKEKIKYKAARLGIAVMEV